MSTSTPTIGRMKRRLRGGLRLGSLDGTDLLLRYVLLHCGCHGEIV